MRFLLMFLLLFIHLNATVIQVISKENCPYACSTDINNEGFVIDLISHVFKKSGYEIEYRTTATHEKAYNEVKDGNYDVLIGANPATDKGLIYMKQPLGYTYNVIAVAKHSKWKYENITSLSSLRIAARKGLVYAKPLHHYLQKAPSSKVQMNSGHLALKQNLKSLRFEKVDAVIDDRASLRYFYFKNKKSFPFKIAHTSSSNTIEIAFSPRSYRSKKYKEMLYKGLKKLKNTKEIKKIMTKYGLSEAYIRHLPQAY